MTTATLNQPHGSDGTRRRRSATAVPNEVLAMLLFLFAETMLFCGLVSAYVVLRSQTLVWPPMGQPRLPVLATAFNTALLVASGWSMWRSVGAIQRGEQTRHIRLLLMTLAGGILFLLVQGAEWLTLIRHGLTVESGLYGSLFYSLIGAHAIHLIVAVAFLAVVARASIRGTFNKTKHEGLLAMRLYWTFVVAIWPPLYALVYLW